MHHRALAAGQIAQADLDALIARVRVIQDSPALRNAANGLLCQQRQALAQVLAGEYGPKAAALMAAQVTASLLTLQETYFQRLLGGAPRASTTTPGPSPATALPGRPSTPGKSGAK